MTEISTPAVIINRKTILAVACASLFACAVSATILPAALLRAAPAFGVDSETLSWVAVTQFSVCFTATIYGGILSDRLGKKPVLVAACLLVMSGAALWSVAWNMAAAHLAGALLGMGGGILESQGSALLADCYPERRRWVFTLSQVTYCVGAVVAPGVIALLLPMGMSWRIVFIGEAFLSGLLLVSYLLVKMPPPAVGAEGELFMESMRLLRRRSVLLPALALFGYVLAESGVALYANRHVQVYFSGPERWAVLGLSLFWAAMLVGRLLCALLPVDLSPAWLIRVLSACGAVALAAQSLSNTWITSVALFALVGLLIGGIWPAIVAVAADLHPQRTGSVVGAVVAIGSVGVAAAPVLLSTFISVGGDQHYFTVLAVALLAAVPVLAAVRPVSLTTQVDQSCAGIFSAKDAT